MSKARFTYNYPAYNPLLKPAKYAVMQQMETGEIVHAPCPNFESMDEAYDWIDNNELQYEESAFWVETVR